MLMKNRLLIFILSLCFLNSQAFTEEFIFKTKNIEIIDNGEFIKTNTLSDLERKVAELEQKHIEKER